MRIPLSELMKVTRARSGPSFSRVGRMITRGIEEAAMTEQSWGPKRTGSGRLFHEQSDRKQPRTACGVTTGVRRGEAMVRSGNYWP